ncbi:MAG: hypothetical protein M3441_09645 [Chloroflexota bacterium]|nr:hypothetical protein [Chloroflexota bacterium]
MRAVDSGLVSRWTVYVVLGLALLAAVFDMPGRAATVANQLPVTRLLFEPDEQYRLHLGGVPYDLLRAADAALPRHATVLLVTPGRDTDTLEYITYHRALYFLAPRSVWWAAPTPPDGTWRSRWWLTTPLTPDALRALAEAKGASYLLVFDVNQPLPMGERILEAPGGYLLRVGNLPPAAAISTNSPGYAGPLWPLGLLLAVAVPTSLGGLALKLAGRLGYRASGVGALAVAWVLGAGLLTLLMLYLSAAGLNLGWQMAAGVLVATLAILPVVGTALRHGRPGSGDARVEWRGVLPPGRRALPHLRVAVQYLLLALMAVQLVLVGVAAMGKPLDVWDSWVNWGVKSRAIFLEGHISPAVYADASRTVTHLDYPLLVPLLQSWLYGWVGAPDDRFAGVASVLFYAALLSICYAAVRGRGGGHTLALAAAATVGTVSQMAGLASIVFAEMPLAVFATVTGVYLLKWLEGGPPGALLLAGMGAGLSCWTKRDGLLFLAAIVVATVMVGWRYRRAWQGAGALVVGTLLVSGPWYAFAAINSTPAPDFHPPGLDVLAANLQRWPTIVELEWASLTSHNWSYIWVLGGLSAPLLLVVGRVSRKPRWSAMVPLAAAIHIVLSGAVYFFSDLVPYEQHILSSIDRLLAPVVPLVILWIAFQAVRPTDLGRLKTHLSNSVEEPGSGL